MLWSARITPLIMTLISVRGSYKPGYGRRESQEHDLDLYLATFDSESYKPGYERCEMHDHDLDIDLYHSCKGLQARVWTLWSAKLRPWPWPWPLLQDLISQGYEHCESHRHDLDLDLATFNSGSYKLGYGNCESHDKYPDLDLATFDSGSYNPGYERCEMHDHDLDLDLYLSCMVLQASVWTLRSA